MIRFIHEDGTTAYLELVEDHWRVTIDRRPIVRATFSEAQYAVVFLDAMEFKRDSSPFRTGPPHLPQPPSGRPGPIVSPAGEAASPPSSASPPGAGADPRQRRLAWDVRTLSRVVVVASVVVAADLAACPPGCSCDAHLRLNTLELYLPQLVEDAADMWHAIAEADSDGVELEADAEVMAGAA